MLADLPGKVVTADMERIFGPLGKRPVAIAPHLRHPSDGNSRARKQTALRYIIIMLTLLLVIGVGIVGYRSIAVQEILKQNTDGLAEQLHIPAILKNRSSHASTLVSTAVPPVTRSSPSDVAPPAATTAALPDSQPTPAPRIKTTRSANIIDDSVADVSAPVRRIAPPLQRDCPPGSEENRCIYRDVLAADARLRLAYNRARQAGVADNILRAANRRWQQALQRSEDAPDLAIERYNRLATMLDQQREDINP